jgi:hypothetical protein
MSRGAFRYRSHGITLESELELPELQPAAASEPVDVAIRYGAVPERLDGRVTHGPGYQAAPGRYLLQVPRLARYWVGDGREVQIEPRPGAAAADLRVFVLSSVMGALLHQRGALPIHAGAVSAAGCCVLFAGASGAGKSTLTAAFHDRGYGVVSDDISVISFDASGAPHVHPGGRRVKLCADALERVGASLGERNRDGRTSKYSLAVPGVAPPAPPRLTRIFVLEGRAAGTPALRVLSGHSRANAVFGATYRRRLMHALGRRTSHFAQCSALVRSVEVVSATRTARLDQLSELVDAIDGAIRGAARETQASAPP